MLAREQKPLIEGLAAGQPEAGQQLAAIQLGRLLQVGHVRARAEACERGRVEPGIAASAPLDALARDAQRRGRPRLLAERLAQAPQRLTQVLKRDSSARTLSLRKLAIDSPWSLTWNEPSKVMWRRGIAVSLRAVTISPRRLLVRVWSDTWPMLLVNADLNVHIEAGRTDVQPPVAAMLTAMVCRSVQRNEHQLSGQMQQNKRR